MADRAQLVAHGGYNRLALSAVAAEISDAAGSLAALLEGLPAVAWARTGARDGDEPTVLEVAQRGSMSPATTSWISPQGAGRHPGPDQLTRAQLGREHGHPRHPVEGVATLKPPNRGSGCAPDRIHAS